MNTNQKGAIAETAVLAAAVARGYMVSLPVGHCSYDLVIDRHNLLERVQVKYLTLRNGKVLVRFNDPTTLNNNVNYTSTNVDALVIYESLSGRIFWIPVSVGEHCSTINIRLNPAANGQKSGIRNALEFESW